MTLNPATRAEVHATARRMMEDGIQLLSFLFENGVCAPSEGPRASCPPRQPETPAKSSVWMIQIQNARFTLSVNGAERTWSLPERYAGLHCNAIARFDPADITTAEIHSYGQGHRLHPLGTATLLAL